MLNKFYYSTCMIVKNDLEPPTKVIPVSDAPKKTLSPATSWINVCVLLTVDERRARDPYSSSASNLTGSLPCFEKIATPTLETPAKEYRLVCT